MARKTERVLGSCMLRSHAAATLKLQNGLKYAIDGGLLCGQLGRVHPGEVAAADAELRKNTSLRIGPRWPTGRVTGVMPLSTVAQRSCCNT